MTILIVLTSHDQLGDTNRKTGFWLEEFAAPYYAFIDAGQAVVLASPKGGQPPLDPSSDKPDMQTPATERFKNDPAAQHALAHTQPLAEIDAAAFDALFYPGGHGPLWDLTNSEVSQQLIRHFQEQNKPTAFVCHAPAVLKNVTTASGEALVAGKHLTGFSNSEEAQAGLTDVVPFLLEDALQAKGAIYSKGQDWSAYVVSDGLLITGQNPQSSAATAQSLLTLLENNA